jgi:HK97 family phage portal protein
MSFNSWFKGLTFQDRTEFYNFMPLGGDVNYEKISDSEALSLGYMTSSAWYAIAQNIAAGVSSLPLSLIKVNSSGETETVLDGAAYDYIFHPNDHQTISEFWEEIIIYLVTNGELFSYKRRKSIGFIDANIISLPPELVTVNTNNPNSILSEIQNYTLKDGGKETTILLEDMLHVKLTNPSVEGRKAHNGLSPLQAGKTSLSTSNQIETAGEAYYKNGGYKVIISGAANNGGLTLQTKDRQSINDAFKSLVGGANRMNQAHITSAPIDVNTISAPASDMQMLESAAKELRRLASLVRLPSIVVGDMENTTYSNYATAVKVAYTDVYLPFADKLIKGYERSYLKDISKMDGVTYKLKINKHKIEALNLSPAEQHKEIRENVAAGLISRNEGREKLGETLLDIPEMDIPTVQTSITQITNLGNEEETK